MYNKITLNDQFDQAENMTSPVNESASHLTEKALNSENINFESGTKIPHKSRTILWYIVFFGFIVNNIIRCNINIAMVSMVMPRKSTNNSDIKISECFNHSAASSFANDSTQYSEVDAALTKRYSIERHIMDLFQMHYDKNGFDWDEYQQSILFGSFYWLCWTTEIPGGFLAKRYGTKLVAGLSSFLSCVISIFLPIAAYLNFQTLLILRMIQGILNGFFWTSMHELISQWIPPNERSRFVSAYMGGSVGIAIVYPLFGFVISISSWEWIFHLSSSCGIVWYIFWQYCVYDSPSEHPRIDPNELNYISKSLGDSVQNDRKMKIPWKSILVSVPFWLTVAAQWGGMWTSFTLITQLPTYFKFIHGMNYQMSGLLSGLPYILRMIFAYGLSMFLDHLLQTKKMTRTNVRKVAVVFNNIICGIVTCCLAYVGCNFVMGIILVSLVVALLGAQSPGPLSSMVDLAPNFSSILFGISSSANVLSGIFSAYIVGIFTLNNQTIQQWQYIFLISAGISTVTGITYILFSNSDEQHWNKSTNMRGMTGLTKKRTNPKNSSLRVSH